MNRSDNLRPERALPAMRPWLVALLLVGITSIVYFPALRGSFIWDDGIILTDNPIVQASNGLHYAWFSTSGSDYIPVTLTSFWLEWRLWGNNPIGYRIVNILLHAGSALLLWRILSRLNIPGALVAALLFAVHPVCVPSVAWVAERKNTLSLFFYLAALLWFVRGDDVTQKQGSTFNRWHWQALICFALAVLSKQSVVVLPAVMMLIVWWRRGSITRIDFFRLLPFAALSFLASLMVISMQDRALMGEVAHGESIVTRLLGGMWAAWFYLWKAILPLNLSIIYPRWRIDTGAWLHWIPVLVWIAVGLWLWKKRNTWGRAGLFALGYFFITLAPVLGLFDMVYFGFSRAADHLQYIALIGTLALLAFGLHKLGKGFAPNSKGVFILPSAIVLMAFAALGFKRAELFRSPEKLWRDALRSNPNSSPVHYNLAGVLEETGRFDEAIHHFQEAIRLNPANAGAINNLGYVFHRLGNVAAAETNYLAALQVNPRHPDAHGNLGALALQRGDLDAATNHLIQAINIRPTMVEAHYNLAKALMVVGQFNKASQHLQAAIDNRPGFEAAVRDLDAFNYLTREWKGSSAALMNEAAVNLAQKKQYIDALFLLNLALETGQDRGSTHRNIASVYLIMGKRDLAIAHNRLSLQVDADSTRALNNLSWLLATQPDASKADREEGLSLASRAVSLSDGKDPQLLDTLAICYAAVGNLDKAAATAVKARGVALALGQTNLVAKLDKRLEAFKRGEVWIE